MFLVCRVGLDMQKFKQDVKLMKLGIELNVIGFLVYGWE
jgi:hypothetical protein